MRCTVKKTIAKIVHGKNHFCIALKKNQPKPYELAANVHQQNAAEVYSEIQRQRQRGRYEERYDQRLLMKDVSMTPQQQTLLAGWKHIRCIVKVVRRRTVKSETSEHSHYYVSDCEFHTGEFAKGIRNHWAIENRLHWVKDGFYKKDDPRLKSDKAAKNFSCLCSMVTGILNRGGCGNSFKERTRFFTNRIDRIWNTPGLLPPQQLN